MKIAVLCKAVASVVSDVAIAPGGRSVQYHGQSVVMNESDDYALAEAIYLKRTYGGEVTVLAMGSITCQDILYLALAKGADRAVRVDAQVQDSQAASIVLAAALKRLEWDLILTGTQSRDTLAGAVGIAVAGRLQIPFAFAVTEVEAEDGRSLKVRKELGSGRHAEVRLPLPALLCVQTGIQPLAYVPPARMQRARQQPMRSLSLTDLGLTKDELVPQGYQYVDVFPPKRTGNVQFLTGSDREVADAILARIAEAI